MWLIVGLGNPGSKYDNTPHNLGFELVDELARRHNLSWQDARKFQAVVATGSIKGEKIYFMKPVTFMNLSGSAVQSFASYYNIVPKDIMAVCDDINLPWGRMRLRERGSHGGHNGLRNIIATLGTEEYCRLRLGCAPEKDVDMVRYVLGQLGSKERATANQTIEAGCDCIEEWLATGPAKAMAVYNGWKAD